MGTKWAVGHQYGDIDGDGFCEYLTRSGTKSENTIRLSVPLIKRTVRHTFPVSCRQSGKIMALGRGRIGSPYCDQEADINTKVSAIPLSNCFSFRTSDVIDRRKGGVRCSHTGFTVISRERETTGRKIYPFTLGHEIAVDEFLEKVG